jgi:hypothetical protein
MTESEYKIQKGRTDIYLTLSIRLKDVRDVLDKIQQFSLVTFEPPNSVGHCKTVFLFDDLKEDLIMVFKKHEVLIQEEMEKI